MHLLLLLTGCSVTDAWLAPGDDGDGLVSLAGYVYSSPFPESTDAIITGDAQVEFFDLDGGSLAVAEEPFADDYPGYWRARLPPDTDYQLRIDGGEGTRPALWRGVSPPSSGFWPATAPVLEADQRAAVFGWDAALVDEFFASVGESEAISVDDLDDGESSHLWGGPANPDAVRGDSLRVVDGDGDEVAVYAYVIDPATLTLSRTSGSPVHYFVALNLAPGDISVAIDGADGGVAEATWRAEGGEVIAPWFFEEP